MNSLFRWSDGRNVEMQLNVRVKAHVLPVEGGLVISNRTVPVSMSLILNLVKSMLCMFCSGPQRKSLGRKPNPTTIQHVPRHVFTLAQELGLL